jgi:hypothetical protein
LLTLNSSRFAPNRTSNQKGGRSVPEVVAFPDLIAEAIADPETEKVSCIFAARGPGIDRPMHHGRLLSWLLVAIAALVIGYLFYALYFIFG